MQKFKWWGYLHTNGKIQVKRYFEPLDISEAEESPFVERTFGPYEVFDRADAINYIMDIIKGEIDND